MTTDNDIITQLDWPTTHIRCQCDNTRCANGCKNPATRHVEIHSIDDCNRADLGQFGNLVTLLCETCYTTTRLVIEQLVDTLTRYGRAHCRGCGAPLADITDVIREDQPL